MQLRNSQKSTGAGALPGPMAPPLSIPRFQTMVLIVWMSV